MKITTRVTDDVTKHNEQVSLTYCSHFEMDSHLVWLLTLTRDSSVRVLGAGFPHSPHTAGWHGGCVMSHTPSNRTSLWSIQQNIIHVSTSPKITLSAWNECTLNKWSFAHLQETISRVCVLCQWCWSWPWWQTPPHTPHTQIRWEDCRRWAVHSHSHTKML